MITNEARTGQACARLCLLLAQEDDALMVLDRVYQEAADKLRYAVGGEADECIHAAWTRLEKNHDWDASVHNARRKTLAAYLDAITEGDKKDPWRFAVIGWYAKQEEIWGVDEDSWRYWYAELDEYTCLEELTPAQDRRVAQLEAWLGY